MHEIFHYRSRLMERDYRKWVGAKLLKYGKNTGIAWGHFPRQQRRLLCAGHDCRDDRFQQGHYNFRSRIHMCQNCITELAFLSFDRLIPEGASYQLSIPDACLKKEQACHVKTENPVWCPCCLDLDLRHPLLGSQNWTDVWKVSSNTSLVPKRQSLALPHQVV